MTEISGDLVIPKSKIHTQFSQILFVCIFILCLTPFISSSMALLLGIVFSVCVGNPYLNYSQKLSKYLLQISVVGLGAGMNLAVIGHEGLHSLPYTAIGITAIMLVGLVIGKLLKTETTTSLLITVGTAICGGSAIAAVAPVVQAKSHEISVALATIFFLNAMALFIFPPLGHYYNLSQSQFGIWCALAIHDTSSVIGAALQYGSNAVSIATTVKLVRALWIIPLALIVSTVWNYMIKDKASAKPKYPVFILFFILMASIVTFIPALQPLGLVISSLAKQSLILTLFLIGACLTRSTIQSVGVRPFIQGIVLWVAMAGATLFAIAMGVIN